MNVPFACDCSVDADSELDSEASPVACRLVIATSWGSDWGRGILHLLGEFMSGVISLSVDICAPWQKSERHMGCSYSMTTRLTCRKTVSDGNLIRGGF
jgi:hypothetical protein